MHGSDSEMRLKSSSDEIAPRSFHSESLEADEIRGLNEADKVPYEEQPDMMVSVGSTRFGPFGLPRSQDRRKKLDFFPGSAFGLKCYTSLYN